ncbi:MAG: hypothetical protein OEX23_03290 [Betaproteobacteria bacterium]|nr:hypothetical protein [Betaproteobacteria bacterium]
MRLRPAAGHGFARAAITLQFNQFDDIGAIVAAMTGLNAEALPGYRGMGPVRFGNDAYRQVQNDVFGAGVLAAMHVFFDERLAWHGDAALFARLESLGREAAARHDRPDAGPWELHGARRVHTFSAVMCRAACDRLGLYAEHLDPASGEHWGNYVQTYSMVGLIGCAIRLSLPWDEAF